MGNDVFQQLALFVDADSTQTGSDGLSWSYSRRQALEQCPLRYYNLYYGANQRTAKQDSAKQQLRFLKSLSNRHLRTGDLMHLAIKTYFYRARQGVHWGEHQLTQFARRIFEEDRNYSRKHPDGSDVESSPYPPALLREFHYRQDDSDALCQEAEDRLVQALSNFAAAECFASLRRAGMLEESLIEHTFKLTGFPCQVSGKIDLAFADPACVTVVDWKLGASDGDGSASLQLAVYGLWATERFSCSASDVRICKAHLSSGEIIDFSIDETLIAAARARIQQDIERMAALHEYGQRGLADAFTPCLQPAICRMCAFERECYD